MSKKNLTIMVVALVVLVVGIGGYVAATGWFDPQSHDSAATTSTTPTPTVAQSGQSETTSSVSYAGVEGRTALELLQEQYPEAQITGTGVNAYVTSINGYTADESKQEYWAFYVNGAMADVGAGSYATKDGDTIEWKIATY